MERAAADDIMAMTLLNPVDHFLAFRQVVGLLSRNRQLTWEMTKRELAQRYTGHVLGLVWVVGSPLLLMAVYAFVFGYIFQARIGGTVELPRDYTTFLLGGLIPWLTFQEALNKGPGVVLGNASLVKQIVFPIEVLPVSTVLTSLLTQLVATAFLAGYMLVTTGTLPWTFVLLPALFAIQSLAMIGACYILAAVGVYFRDLREVVSVLTSMGFFLMPALYIPNLAPGILHDFFYVNPFSYMVWCYQDATYFGRFEHPWAWAIFPALSLATFYVGYRVFRKLKSSFGSVL